MPRLGGINIPFVVDMTDIPKSIKLAERQLQQLRKRVGDIDLRIDGKWIDKLGTDTLRPLIRQFKTVEESAKTTTARIKVLANAINTLRGGKPLGQAAQEAIGLMPGIGPKTIEQIQKARKMMVGQEAATQEQINAARARAVQLLKNALVHNQKLLAQTKQIFVLEASPKVSAARRMQRSHIVGLAKEYGKLYAKRKLGIINEREAIRLAETMNLLLQQRARFSDRVLKEQQAINKEAKKAAALQRRGGMFPGGGLFSPMRLGWFLQLRAYWEVFRVLQKIATEMLDLDEATGRAMRTMVSHGKSYEETSEMVRKTIVETGALTGATYKDIGEALYQLSSAGLSAEESLAAVNSVMRLTRTTEADVTDATKVIAGVFNNFKSILDTVTSDTEAFAKISGVLSYVWERNQVDMNEMVQALNQSAQISQLAGLSFENLSVIIGNLGTMMIRSGRAGRSLRTAIIQMAARGQELSDAFDLSFDPGKPINFIRVMNKLHASFKDLNQTALVTEKITEIFGRRGAPAILALLRNWEKVREEMGGIGSALELATKQQEKMLRLQERYRQVTETTWKEILSYIAEYADVVDYIRGHILDILERFREKRARKITGESMAELLLRFNDSGAAMEELARISALLRISQGKLNKELRDGIGIWDQILTYKYGIWYWTTEARELKKTIKAYQDAYAHLYKFYSLTKTVETLQKDREREADLSARPVYTEADAWDALTDTLAEHHAVRGELVYTREQLTSKLVKENKALVTMKDSWVKLFITHKGSEELLKSVTKELTDQADTVRKLADTLLKLHKFEENVLKKQQKNELAFYDARIKYQDAYAEAVGKYVGAVEVREAQVIRERIERMKIEQSQMQALIALKQPIVNAYEALAEAGKLPPEVVEKWNELVTQITDLKIQAKLAGKEVSRLSMELQFVAKESEMIPAIAARRRAGIVPSRTGFEEQYISGIFAEQTKVTERRQKFEMESLEQRHAAQEKYQALWHPFKRTEELEERAELKRRREILELQRSQMLERMLDIDTQIKAEKRLRDTTDDSDVQAQSEKNIKALRTEQEDLRYQLALNAQEYANSQKTFKEMQNEKIRLLMKEGDTWGATQTLIGTYGDTIQQHTGDMVEAWKEMFAYWGQKSKSAWDAYKAIAIAQAIVDTFKTAQAGASALAGIPFVGPALAAAWIATAIAQGMMRVRMIEAQKPAQQYAQGGVVYGDLVLMDRKRAQQASYATGGVTSGPTIAKVGDNKSGREIILPEEHIHDNYVGPAYRRQRGESDIHIYNLVTNEDIAAAMNEKSGRRVIVNAVGRDLREKRSTYQAVNRRR